MFARPQTQDGSPSDEAEEIVPGPPSKPTEEQLQALLERAEAAARAGRVKQTLVLDERTRVKVDARFGKAKVQRLDAATLDKMMGGKDRPLRPDASANLLRVIGIMNPDGSISAKHAKKYKQVNHFVQLCRPVLQQLGARLSESERPLRVADLGCGNAYLTFVLAEALRLADMPAKIYGVDRRVDVIERARQRARTLGWSHVSFEVVGIEQADPVTALGGPPDLLLALHACDTATDDALVLAVKHGTPAIFAAPCCQHELAGQLQTAGVQTAPVPALLEHGLLRQDYAAMLTDALRVELLEAAGYEVDLLEFVSAEHTPKNLLIRAQLKGEPGVDARALQAVRQRCSSLGVEPKLLRLLEPAG